MKTSATTSNHDIFAGLPTEKLSPAQEAICAVERDYDRLILHNLREAVLYTGRCCRGAIEPGELLSLCYAALRKSAPRFRSGGITFLAYSKADLRGEISRHWKSQDCVRNSYFHESADEPTIRRTSLISGAEEGETFTAAWEGADVLEENYSEPEWGAIEMRERMALIRPIMDSVLNERERTVVQLTYESGFSFEQIAGLMVPRVCREAIRMTHERALRKVRNALLRNKRLYSTV